MRKKLAGIALMLIAVVAVTFGLPTQAHETATEKDPGAVAIFNLAGQEMPVTATSPWPTIIVALFATAAAFGYAVRRLNILRKPTLHKALQMVSYFLLPIALAAATNLLPSESIRDFARELGEWSLYLFAAIMFAKPLWTFMPKNKALGKIVAWRKEFGIAIFYLALFHALGVFMSTNLWGQAERWLYPSWHANFFGTLSFLMLLLLYLTSNSFSYRKMKRNWKRLHYLAYPALLLALMHKFGYENRLWPAYVIFLVFAALKATEFRNAAKRRRSAHAVSAKPRKLPPPAS